MLLAKHLTHRRRPIARLRLDGIQRADASQGVLGHRMTPRRLQVEELSSAMRQTGQLGHALAKQFLVTAVVIDHQMAAPVLQEIPRMLTAAAGLIVEHHDARRPLQVIAAVSPQISAPGLAAARIELLDRRFIGMQNLALFEQQRQSIHQGLQRHAQLTDPLRQRRAGDRHALARADLLDPIQRQMIQVFLDQDPRMQAGSGQSTIDERGGDRGRADGFAVTAGILRANMAMNEEAGRLDIQLLADVFADLDQIAPALSAGTRGRLVPVFDARQLRR